MLGMDWEELLDQRKYELEKLSPPEAGVPIPPPTIRPRRKSRPRGSRDRRLSSTHAAIVGTKVDD